MTKSCPEHGPAETCLWPDIDHYRWMNDLRLPFVAPRRPVPALKGCPADCGLCASHLRQPTLVEIEVTERCNLRCPVCFMSAEDYRARRAPDPTLEDLRELFEEILRRTSPQTAVQVTGGEPTFRADLPEIIRLGRAVGLEYLEVNTNGVELSRDPAYALALKAAGASGVYLQFDGLTDDVYRRTRGLDLAETKNRAIEHCRRAGLQVVLAMTIIDGVNETQIGDVLRFALAHRDVVAGIAYQPAFGSGRFEATKGRRLTMGHVIYLLAEQSGGLLTPYDVWPLGCSHPLCSSSVYLMEMNGVLQPLTRLITPRDYLERFDPDSPQGSVLADIAFNCFPEAEVGMAIVVMNYMDADNLDLRKARECGMTVMSREGRIVPFCHYQLTNRDGRRRSEL
jgi:uncharacterized radical SAM superfamily Fe-S cluster-containing enzyme